MRSDGATSSLPVRRPNPVTKRKPPEDHLKPGPKPRWGVKAIKRSLDLPPELNRRLNREAKQQGLSFAELVRRVMQEWLDGAETK